MCPKYLSEHTHYCWMSPQEVCSLKHRIPFMNLQFGRHLNRGSYDRFLGTFRRLVKVPYWQRPKYASLRLYLPSLIWAHLRTILYGTFSLSSQKSRLVCGVLPHPEKKSKRGICSLGQILFHSSWVLRRGNVPWSFWATSFKALLPWLGQGRDWDLRLRFSLAAWNDGFLV